ncbi:uncharacterized protein LY89DRAFT_667278 [Mollisia scopiformis]|uniref:Uncharacterized protein n=1 Tax=Mollisia scopiformis TaxID=149040 RepID=A0A194XHQ9_MOLSC|nr:uncharacterized protein LY89DRAFT_667278 [Mollisia scopiformis]KUJ19307.1 hypothetical protein LY89DRAFT_667278 [Mollisia scopiformis]
MPPSEQEIEEELERLLNTNADDFLKRMNSLHLIRYYSDFPKTKPAMPPSQQAVQRILRLSGKQFLQVIKYMDVKELPSEEERVAQGFSHHFLQLIADAQKVAPIKFMLNQVVLGGPSQDTEQMNERKDLSNQMLMHPHTIGARACGLILKGLPQDDESNAWLERYVESILRDVKIVDRKLRLKMILEGRVIWCLFGLQFGEDGTGQLINASEMQVTVPWTYTDKLIICLSQPPKEIIRWAQNMLADSTKWTTDPDCGNERIVNIINTVGTGPELFPHEADPIGVRATSLLFQTAARYQESDKAMERMAAKTMRVWLYQAKASLHRSKNLMVSADLDSSVLNDNE